MHVDWKWWWGKDLNLRRRRRQIYSLFPLTTREPHHWGACCHAPSDIKDANEDGQYSNEFGKINPKMTSNRDIPQSQEFLVH